MMLPNVLCIFWLTIVVIVCSSVVFCILTYFIFSICLKSCKIKDARWEIHKNISNYLSSIHSHWRIKWRNTSRLAYIFPYFLINIIGIHYIFLPLKKVSHECVYWIALMDTIMNCFSNFVWVENISAGSALYPDHCAWNKMKGLSKSFIA